MKSASDSVQNLSRSIANARVDLNPHQVDAALFAFRPPLAKGDILADVVRLGKTIEAGIVIAQSWAENRRRILLILPATLRNQWQQEMEGRAKRPDLLRVVRRETEEGRRRRNQRVISRQSSKRDQPWK